MNKFQDYIASRRAAVSAIADAAISVGMPVFPCGPTKQPMTAHGFKDASADPEIIRRLFTPTSSMIGVPTGTITGWAVIDIDTKDGAKGQEWLDANQHRLPSTRTHATRSGGWHLIFKMPMGDMRNSASKIAPGVDVRANGGYVIVPPSPGYHLIPDGPDPADMPEWLIVAAMPEPKPEPVQRSVLTTPRPIMDGNGTYYGIAALERECDSIRHAPDGTKHDTLNKAAFSIGGLVTAGELLRGDAFAQLSSALDAILPSCRDKRAAQNTLRRSFEEGMGQPRDVPERPAQEPEEIHPAAQLIAKMSATAAKRSSEPLAVAPGIMDVDGVLKELVDACVETAIRPQPFLALGAAICAVGALAGRKYRTKTDLRTNIYVAAMCESGGGKDHPSEIIRRCLDEAGLEQYLGGETLASGRAVLSSLENHPSKLFQVDEFGLFLQGVTGKKAAAHKSEIWSELMKLYSRAKGIYRGTEYANKKDNPRIDIHEPCACFYGTTTPITFWNAIEGGAMSDGSLARFLVFITDNHRPERNLDPGIFKPSPKLTASLRDITMGQGAPPPMGNLPTIHSVPMLASKSYEPFTVPMTPEADRLHTSNLSREDAWARKVEGTQKAAIVNRLAENSAKLSLISAVSRNPSHPMITERDVAWAWALAEHCTKSFLSAAETLISDTEFEGRLNKAYNIIRKHGPVSRRDMFHKGFKPNDRDFNEAIISLVNNGLIIEIKTAPTGPGRPSIKYAVSGVSYNDTGNSEDE